MHVCPMVTPGVPPIPHVGGPIVVGAPNVLTCSQPQARMSDTATCVGPPDVIVRGSAGVMVCGLPAARMGDNTAHGGVITMGAPTVLIGETAAGAGGGGGGGAPGAPGGPGSSASGSGAATDQPGQAGLAMRNAPPGETEPGQMTDVELQARTLQSASDTGAPFCEACEQARQAEKARKESLGAQAMTGGDGPAFGGDGDGGMAAHEATHTTQQGGSGKPPGRR